MEWSLKEKLELILIYVLGYDSEVEKTDTKIQDVKNNKKYYLLYLERACRKQKMCMY